METEVDRPVATQVSEIRGTIKLRTWAHTVGEAMFCNVYDITWEPGSATARVDISTRPVDGQAAGHSAGALVTAPAGFFFLADRCSGLPRQSSLNLAISGGQIRSLPVTDREAVLSRRSTLSAGYVRARGLLVLDGTTLTWAGSRAPRSADCYVYGNGNAVICHQSDPVTGALRVLDEASRLTPPIAADGTMTDIGFMSMADGGFRAVATSPSGGMDIFTHDLVLRCPADFTRPRCPNRAEILEIDWLRCNDLPDAAVSAGPSLDCPDFTAHPVNHDGSLGSRPPFTGRRMARMVLFADSQNRVHLRLFDGRPQSRAFPGVTPAEARETIARDTAYRWGCFLDPGQTAKLWVHGENGMTSYGSRHYLRWPDNPAGGFAWVPDAGRAVSSFITVCQLPAAHVVPVHAAERRQVWFTEQLPHRLERHRLILPEAPDLLRVGRGSEESRRVRLGVKLVRVHYKHFLAGFRPVVRDGQGKRLANHVAGTETDSRVACGEPADHLGQALLAQQPIAENPVPDIICVVKFACRVIQAVDPHIVQKAAGPHQPRVETQAGPGKKLLRYPAHNHTVRVHQIQRLRCGCVLFMQGNDLLVCRDLHGRRA